MLLLPILHRLPRSLRTPLLALRRPLATVRPPRLFVARTMASATPRILPECWGHRGASARYPENTLASFEAAIRDGAEGIESDVHVSNDDVVIMFHDPSLDRTTNGKGFIKEQKWYGEDGMEHLRTVKEPKQSIPTFAETVALLMKPENQHVKFNVDVKVQNDPDHLFSLMSRIITSHANWETVLAPRLLIGLWHPRFLAPAALHLPHCRRAYIGVNVAAARRYFWDSCDAFSVLFDALVGSEGEKFRKACKTEGKQLCVWTVNDPAHMVEAVRWGVDAILTDHTKTWLNIRANLQTDYEKQMSTASRLFLWTTPRFYPPMLYARKLTSHAHLERVGGPFDAVDPVVTAVLPAMKVVV